MPVDIIAFLIFGIIAITLSIIYRRTKLLNELVTRGARKYAFTEYYATTPYDKLEKNDLDKILNRLLNNYRILMTIYGILLAFVISDKISYALSSWSLIIWAGWILAVVLKTGLTSLHLTDIIETESSLEILRRKIFSAKQFQRHTLILLVVSVAFLPVLFIAPEPNVGILEKLPWDISISIFSGAFGIIGTFLFFYFIPLQTKRFEVRGGTFDTYLYIILLMTMISVGYYAKSPLEPVLVTIHGIVTFYIPTIFYTVLWMMFPAGIGALTPLIRGLLTSSDKSKDVK